MKLANLVALMIDGKFVGEAALAVKQVPVNCEHISGLNPRKCYITRQECCGSTDIQYGITFAAPEDMTNVLEGFFVEVDGRGIVVDIVSADTLIAYCADCCDGTATITRQYPVDEDGAETVPAYESPATSTFCITRADDGSGVAINKAVMDYAGRVDSIVLFSASGTSSKYTVKALSKPKPIGADTVATGACS